MAVNYSYVGVRPVEVSWTACYSGFAMVTKLRIQCLKNYTWLKMKAFDLQWGLLSPEGDQSK